MSIATTDDIYTSDGQDEETRRRRAKMIIIIIAHHRGTRCCSLMIAKPDLSLWSRGVGRVQIEILKSIKPCEIIE